MRVFVIAACLALLAACSHRTQLMQANVVSMSKPHLKKGQNLKNLGPVTGKFCPEAFKSSTGKDMGLIDEAVRAAQKESGADFILNAEIFEEGGCVGVEGEGAKIRGG